MTRTAWAIGETRQEALWAAVAVLAGELFAAYPRGSLSAELQCALVNSRLSLRFGGFGTALQ
jgi:hypothetical protein